MSRIIITLILVVISFAQAFAEERVGVLSLDELYLSPTFHYFEGRNGSFEFGDSSAALRWRRDETVSAVLMLGNYDLLGVPRRYLTSAEDGEKIAVLEAYGEALTALGRFRLGQIPLPFGTEAARGEARLRLPRSLLLREKWMGLRDRGVSFFVENRGFFSEWAVHNGESGADKDNQIWFTSRLGWYGGRGWYVGASGAVGRTTPASTASSALPARTSADAGLNPLESSKVRIGNAFIEWGTNPLAIVLEATAGETLQASGTSAFRGAHADLNYSISKYVGSVARYDILDPSKSAGDRREEATLGLYFKGLYQTSVLYLLGTRIHREGISPDRHEGMLIWRLTPVTR